MRPAPARSHGRALRLLGAGQVALLVPLLALERRMQRTGGTGIVAFELAGTPERARSTMRAWGDDGRAAARASLLLDFPFLATYTAFNRAAAAAAGQALDRAGVPALARAAGPLRTAQLAAGACDAVENAALLGVLAGHDERLPAVANAFARAKFAFLGLGWAYSALGLAATALTRLR